MARLIKVQHLSNIGDFYLQSVHHPLTYNKFYNLDSTLLPLA